ncbi:MAG: beta-lactamase domain protein [Actinomycetia bacterium]|nr:beta-lactamase domain protein [Actinomycetes bacterium]
MSVLPCVGIGDIRIWPLLDGRMTVDEPPGFPAADDPEYAVHAEYIHDGKWHIDIGGFLVQSGDRLVLVDAGTGPGDGEVFAPNLDDSRAELVHWAAANGMTDPEQVLTALQSLARTDIRTGSLAANLGQIGFRPEDVTDVLLSHLHFDHIGWVSMDGKPFFPNAVIRCERHDAEHFLAPEHDDTFYRVMWNAMPTSERMAPILDRFEPWDEDALIVPGIECCFGPGHTPGSSFFSITSGSEQALILGDAVHCPQELMDPDFNGTGGDFDPEQSEATRDRIRRDAADQQVLLSAPHFPRLQFGRLHVGERARRWHFRWQS